MTIRTFKLADHIAIVIQPQPRHALQDRIRRLRGRARAVRVLNPQQELAATPARIKPVKQRSARAADMQKAGRRGGEAGDDGGHRRFTLQ